MSLSVLEPIVTSLVEGGKFGNVSFSCLETDDTEKGAQFSSDLTFLNLTLNGPKGKEVLPLVVKQQVNNITARGSRNYDAMFHNEVVMYKEILPDLGIKTNFYSQMIYGLATNGAQPDKDILILENLKYKHFLPPKKKVFLDIDHISVAIKKIAEFHSFSFIYKQKDMESFQQMTKKFKSVLSTPDSVLQFEVINAACIERGIKPCLEDNVNVDILNNCLRLLRYPIKMRDLLSSPEGSFAVICHGDFCNNNILYKFDENDKPIDCVFVDFQYSMYGSPAIDIFFFLYLNTTSELREEYWDKILKLYWDTLRKCVPDEIPIPSFDEFLNHFAERAIYGYTIAAFFLPVMIENKSFDENETQPTKLEEIVAMMISIGGEEADRKLNEIVLHLINKGYINAFIEFCKNKKVEC